MSTNTSAATDDGLVAEIEQISIEIRRLQEELAEKEKLLAVTRMKLDCIHHRRIDLQDTAATCDHHVRRLAMFLKFKDNIIAQQ
ncbi:hypothetical protein PG999_012205 [Apiospora kogelbergensis]|uniref:Uncharacterized protein n=1 Tax=Apiospora kogelbergensis TaxID=1337665 RepID=A0AAW0QJG4_9PEZI